MGSHATVGNGIIAQSQDTKRPTLQSQMTSIPSYHRTLRETSKNSTAITVTRSDSDKQPCYYQMSTPGRTPPTFTPNTRSKATTASSKTRVPSSQHSKSSAGGSSVNVSKGCNASSNNRASKHNYQEYRSTLLQSSNGSASSLKGSFGRADRRLTEGLLQLGSASPGVYAYDTKTFNTIGGSQLARRTQGGAISRASRWRTDSLSRSFSTGGDCNPDCLSTECAGRTTQTQKLGDRPNLSRAPPNSARASSLSHRSKIQYVERPPPGPMSYSPRFEVCSRRRLR